MSNGSFNMGGASPFAFGGRYPNPPVTTNIDLTRGLGVTSRHDALRTLVARHHVRPIVLAIEAKIATADWPICVTHELDESAEPFWPLIEELYTGAGWTVTFLRPNFAAGSTAGTTETTTGCHIRLT